MGLQARTHGVPGLSPTSPQIHAPMEYVTATIAELKQTAISPRKLIFAAPSKGFGQGGNNALQASVGGIFAPDGQNRAGFQDQTVIQDAQMVGREG
jgi:hypothetical protein